MKLQILTIVLLCINCLATTIYPSVGDYGLGDDSNSEWIVHNEDSINFSHFFEISLEVKEALRQGKPIVALESTVISHGNWFLIIYLLGSKGMPYPQNLETGLAIEAIVRQNGAIPATIALLNGRIHIGTRQIVLEIDRRV
jgi:pseudouridine-5'-phosphate glycosidase